MADLADQSSRMLLVAQPSKPALNLTASVRDNAPRASTLAVPPHSSHRESKQLQQLAPAALEMTAISVTVPGMFADADVP